MFVVLERESYREKINQIPAWLVLTNVTTSFNLSVGIQLKTRVNT